ncbi:hypothetical protein [Arthrobacter sp. UYEF20]|uniref:hypothetical protein n=1 Tax=Arthrobacter sp. UYEF20 TaxID=1756363 RepID=UPI0033971E68
MRELELAGIAARLYALPFDDFVAARTAAAKEVATAPGKGPAAKQQQSLAAAVRSLPKPSVAAWTVNMLAARQPETLRELAALGQSMRAAQSALDAAELRKLAQHRRQLLAAAVRDAQAVAAQQGRKISGAIATEVEETLRAATADEGAAAAARSGRLLRGLSADGVDVVDLAGAVALPSLAIPEASVAVPSRVPTSSSAPAGARATKHAAPKQAAQPRLQAVREEPRAPTPSALERARAALDQAEQSAREATKEALRYAQELDEARALAAGLAEAALTLRKQLEQTELDLKSARKQHELVAAQAQQAVRASDTARRKEDLARERVLRLGNTPG